MKKKILVRAVLIGLRTHMVMKPVQNDHVNTGFTTRDVCSRSRDVRELVFH